MKAYHGCETGTGDSLSCDSVARLRLGHQIHNIIWDGLRRLSLRLEQEFHSKLILPQTKMLLYLP